MKFDDVWRDCENLVSVIRKEADDDRAATWAAAFWHARIRDHYQKYIGWLVLAVMAQTAIIALLVFG